MDLLDYDKSGDLLNSILREIVDGIITIDSAGQIESVNPAAERIFGYSSKELMGKNIKILMPDPYHKEHDGYLSNYNNTGDKKIIGIGREVVGIKKDGTTFPVDLAVSESSSGDIKFYTGIIRDITQRKQIENELKLFRNLVNQSNDALFIIEPESGEYLDVNETACRYLGFSKSDLVGMKVIDIDDNLTSKRKWKKHSKQVIKEGSSARESYYKRHDGTTFPVEINVKSTTIANKNYFIAIARDITERKKSGAELDLSRQQLQNLFENLDNVFYSFDIKRDILLEISPACYVVFGKKQEDFFKDRWLWKNMIHPEDVKAEDDVWKQVYAGIPSEVQYRIIKPDGEIRWLNDKMRPAFGNKGEVTRIDGIVSDITRDKQYEEALRESENRFRKIFEDSPLGMAMVDMEFGYIDINVSFCKMLGYKKSELMKMTFRDFTHPDDLNKDDKNIKKLVEGELPFYHTEKRYIKKDDSIFWAETTVTIISDEEGEPLYFLSMVEDINERKLAEEELEHYRKNLEKLVENRTEELSEANKNLLKEIGERETAEIALQQFKNTLDATLDSVFMFDPNSLQFTYVNQGAASQLGYTRKKLLELTPLDITPEFKEDEFRKLLSTLITGKKASATFETFHLKKNGEELPVEVFLQYTTPINGASRFVAIARDIRERKIAEAELKESEAKYRQLVENAEDAIYILQDGKFVVSNPATEKITGYTKEDFMSEDFDFINLVAPESKEFILNRSKAREEGINIPSRYEFKGLTKDNQLRDLEAITSSILYKGKQAIQGVIRDVTEQKRQVRENLELAKKLERAQRLESLGVLAGGIAHDLNNILGPIIGYPDIILTTLPDDDPIRNDVEQIKIAAGRARDVVTDLLTMARRGKYEMGAINLNNLVDDYLSSYSFIDIKDKYENISFKFKPGKDIKNLLGSESHLSKVLMNLVINAFESMPAGGKLKISTSNTRIKERQLYYGEIPDGEYVLLEVRDTGEGIKDENLMRIFEPFYSNKSMGKSGSGLGLSVVWGVVKDHNSYLDVNSRMGKGTTFSIYFPVTSDEGSTPKYKDINLQGSETILVIDDNEDQRELAERLLSSLGYTVISVENGRAGIKYLKKHKVDLIILDMIMEDDFDGLDTFEKILDSHPDQKVILASGFSETERVKKAQNLGAGRYVRKPFTREEIGRAIRESLDDG
ncbi:MAG: PAS domain S-box protein [Candidatus Marinimicrobia bacterium]|nr:PAS domain S-box protein [Candidatus Neomarinimicrobiota bacterium]